MQKEISFDFEGARYTIRRTDAGWSFYMRTKDKITKLSAKEFVEVNKRRCKEQGLHYDEVRKNWMQTFGIKDKAA